MKVEVLARAIVEGEIEILRGLESVVEVDDVWMVDFFQDVDLFYCKLLLISKE